MTSEHEHIGRDQAQLYMDGAMSSADSGHVARHLETCARCRTELAMLERIDAALVGLPLHRVRPDFTPAVLRRISPHSETLVKLIEKIPYLVSLSLVLAVMVSIFIWAGVIEPRTVSTTKSFMQQMYSTGEGWIGDIAARGTALLREYVPFAFGNGSVGMSMLVTVVLGGIAVVDFVVGRISNR